MANIDNLLKNDDFVNELMNLTTIDEIINFFDCKGIELNRNDAAALLSGLSEISSAELLNEIELSEVELLTVAGGARKSLAQYILEQLKKKKRGHGGGGRGF